MCVIRRSRITLWGQRWPRVLAAQSMAVWLGGRLAMCCPGCFCVAVSCKLPERGVCVVPL